MKIREKIKQITATSEHIVVLTESDRIVFSHMGSEWQDITPPDSIMEIEEVPRFWFGKHKGESISEVAKKKPDYIEWANQNIQGFNYKIEDGIAIQITEEIPF